MNRILKKLLNLGVTDAQSSHEVKRIRLLNAGAAAWIASSVLFIFMDSLFGIDTLDNVIVHSGAILLMASIITFQYLGWHQIARHFFIIIATSVFMAFANILEPGGLMEYLLLCVPIFSLVLIPNKWTNMAVFILSYTCFIFSLEHHYPDVNIKPTASLILFFSIYMSFGYFKKLNRDNEKSLETQRAQLEIQRNSAIDANAKIEQQRQELVELNKFQSHFWVNLSHEIRTPLTLIKGNISQLLKSEINHQHQQQIEQIDKNTLAIQQLVDNIMDLAKMKSNKLELSFKPIDFILLAKRVLSSFEPLLTQKELQYNFTNHTIHSSLPIYADKIYLERALGNLILNAYKYTSQGRIDIAITKENEEACLSIKDTGCGIPTSDLSHIFDSFYQVKNTTNDTGGTGVGLSFTKEVLQLHAGSISVDSVENQGTSFTIRIPLCQTEMVETSTISFQNEKKEPTKGLTVLLAEDNLDMRKYIKSILCNYNVIEADNGLTALNILQKEKIDILITDFMMPELNGFELVQKIRNDKSAIPVIVLTARVDIQGKMDFLRLGIDDYLTKPFHEEELLLRIEHSIKNANEQNIAISENPDIHEIADEELQIITEAISQNIKNEHFGVTDLAEKFAITERTLSRKIKSLCGLTPNGLIREMKLLKARTICETAPLSSLKALAGEVGFINTNHFTKLYTARFGTKPQIKSPLVLAD